MEEKLKGLWFSTLFVVSLVAIGFEIALTRYFAIASWSEYGYWVISIAMAGFAASGVVLSLFKDFISEKADAVILWAVPLLLMFCSTFGYFAVTINSFNPLELQNPLLWQDQIWNIAKYYLVVFPFFFLAGGYIGLCFIRLQKELSMVYAVDLVGAGIGALLVLLLLFWLHPFYLLSALLPFLAIVAMIAIPQGWRRRFLARLFTVAIFIGCEIILLMFNRADFNQYKGIYPALHVEGNKIVSEMKSPLGYFLVLDNFTERLDIDISNNAALLKTPVPPATYGLYKDGNRITSLLKKAPYDSAYISAALDSAPYRLLQTPKTLLIGTRGGSRIQEAFFLGASSVVALEPDPTINNLIRYGVDGQNPIKLDSSKVEFSRRSPAELISAGARKFDLIDVSSDFLDQSYSNRFAFTREAIQGYFSLLTEHGLISLPVSIREFTVYAVKMLETARQALERSGVAHPERHIMLYRSAWNARILVSKQPVSGDEIRHLKDFCNRLSFDTSFFPDIDPSKVTIWNDLPPLSFEGGEPSENAPGAAQDALMQASIELLAKNSSFVENNFFDIKPVTYDSPFFYNILRLSKIKPILENIAQIPREEIGYLVNVAVVLQACLIALIILLLPLARWYKRLPGKSFILKAIVYFSCLGLGFLFLEIFLIDKISFYLNDNTESFAVVLSSMLIFSGIGSYWSGRFLQTPQKAVLAAGFIVMIWVIAAFFFLDKLMFLSLGMPAMQKLFIVVVLLAPLSIALGFPFALGLSLFKVDSNFLPWAWSLNGAFSVLSTPLANLLSVSFGYSVVLLSAGVLYLLVMLSFPGYET